MPASWAKALRPTIALLGCTGYPTMRLTRRLVRVISGVTTPHHSPPRASARVRRIIAISSTLALPARSPMPLMQPSTWRAPTCTPASELATARPRSLWQCTERVASRSCGQRS